MEFNLLNYIQESYIILIPALYILGVFLKKSNIRDERIPWILTIVGILACLGMRGLNIEAVIQGVLVAGATVLGNQIYIQTFKK